MSTALALVNPSSIHGGDFETLWEVAKAAAERRAGWAYPAEGKFKFEEKMVKTAYANAVNYDGVPGDQYATWKYVINNGLAAWSKARGKGTRADREFVQMRQHNPTNLHDKLVHAITQYDMKQSTKRGYNHYALGLYFNALDQAEEDAKRVPLRRALIENFNGRLLDVVLKTAGVDRATNEEHRYGVAGSTRNPRGRREGLIRNPMYNDAELLNLYHLARTALGSNGESKAARGGYAAREYIKLHPGHSHKRVYLHVMDLVNHGAPVRNGRRRSNPTIPHVQHVELGGACDDCVITIANDDYSGMDDAQEQATREGIEAIGEYLVVGEETGFSHSPCVVCGGLAGNRHDVGYLAELEPGDAVEYEDTELPYEHPLTVGGIDGQGGDYGGGEDVGLLSNPAEPAGVKHVPGSYKPWHVVGIHTGSTLGIFDTRGEAMEYARQYGAQRNGGKRERRNPSSKSDWGQAAWEAGKAAYHHRDATGVSNANVRGYSFSKWFNGFSPREAMHGATKGYLQKSFNEGWDVAKRPGKRNPAMVLPPESSVRLSDRDFARLKLIDKGAIQSGYIDHTMTYGHTYRHARDLANANENATGTQYTVFKHDGKFGVAPTDWVNESWLRTVGNPSQFSRITRHPKYILVRAWGDGENGGSVVGSSDSVLELEERARYLQLPRGQGGGVNETYYVLPAGKRGNENIVSEIRKANGRRNPEDSADAMYESFHGKPSDEVIEYTEELHYHENLAQLGELTEMKVATVTGLDITISFDGAGTQLSCNENGTQLYFIGGDQSIDLASFKMDGEEWVKDSMLLGILYQVTYRTQKGFDEFQLTDYYHDVGEETGVQPVLIYDTLNQVLSVAGGQYQVKDVGIVN